MNPLGKMPDALKAKFSALWIANYGVLVPQLPIGFSDWDFHQFAASGEAARFAPNDTGKLELDLDYWNGDLEELQNFAGVTVTPPNGGTMATWYEVNTTALNIRKGPGANYADIGDLVRDDKIEVTETLGGWHHFVRAYRGVNQLTLVDPLASWCSGAYTVVTTSPVVDPPVPPPVPDLPGQTGIVPPDYILAYWTATNQTRKYIPE